VFEVSYKNVLYKFTVIIIIIIITSIQPANLDQFNVPYIQFG